MSAGLQHLGIQPKPNIDHPDNFPVRFPYTKKRGAGHAPFRHGSLFRKKRTALQPAAVISIIPVKSACPMDLGAIVPKFRKIICSVFFPNGARCFQHQS